MKSNFICFAGEYYQYLGKKLDLHDVAINTGGYESCFLADITIAYVFHVAHERKIFSNCILSQIYRDDGFIIKSKPKKSIKFGSL